MFGKIFKKYCIAALAVIASANANAGIISGDVGVSDQPTSTNLWDLYYEIFFPQFDDLGGSRRLTSVNIWFDGETTGSLTFTNNSTASASYTAQVISEVSLASNFTGVLADELFFLTAGSIGTRGETYESGVLAPNGGQNTVNVPLNPGYLVVSGSEDIPPAAGGMELADFIGTGQLSVFLSSVVSVATSVTGDFTVSGQFATGGELGYIYTYEDVAVPEPIGVAFLGMALIALGCSTRRNIS